MTSKNDYTTTTTEQERQLLLCSSFMEVANAQDISPDYIVGEEWFTQAADWDETTLAASLWFRHINEQVS